MGSALRGIDVVYEGVNIFRVGVIVLHGNLHIHVVLHSLAVDDRGVEALTSSVQVSDKLLDSSLIVEDLLLLLLSVIS